MKGVYIVSGKKDIWKIGCSSDINQRIKSLKKYPTLDKINEIYKIESNDYFILEKIIHNRYKENRIDNKLELFCLTKEDIKHTLEKSQEDIREINLYRDLITKYFKEYSHSMIDIEYYTHRFILYTYLYKDKILKIFDEVNLDVVNAFIFFMDKLPHLVPPNIDKFIKLCYQNIPNQVDRIIKERYEMDEIVKNLNI